MAFTLDPQIIQAIISQGQPQAIGGAMPQGIPPDLLQNVQNTRGALTQGYTPVQQKPPASIQPAFRTDDLIKLLIGFAASAATGKTKNFGDFATGYLSGKTNKSHIDEQRQNQANQVEYQNQINQQNFQHQIGQINAQNAEAALNDFLKERQFQYTVDRQKQADLRQADLDKQATVTKDWNRYYAANTPEEKLIAARNLHSKYRGDPNLPDLSQAEAELNASLTEKKRKPLVAAGGPVNTFNKTISEMVRNTPLNSWPKVRDSLMKQRDSLLKKYEGTISEDDLLTIPEEPSLAAIRLEMEAKLRASGQWDSYWDNVLQWGKSGVDFPGQAPQGELGPMQISGLPQGRMLPGGVIGGNPGAGYAQQIQDAKAKGESGEKVPDLENQRQAIEGLIADKQKKLDKYVKPADDAGWQERAAWAATAGERGRIQKEIDALQARVRNINTKIASGVVGGKVQSVDAETKMAREALAKATTEAQRQAIRDAYKQRTGKTLGK